MGRNQMEGQKWQGSGQEWGKQGGGGRRAKSPW